VSRSTGADASQGRADLDGLVLFGQVSLDGSGDGRGHFGVDLVGGDLEKRFVDLDLFADVLEPAGHGAFGHGFAASGHRDLGSLSAGLGAGTRLARRGLGSWRPSRAGSGPEADSGGAGSAGAGSWVAAGSSGAAVSSDAPVSSAGSAAGAESSESEPLPSPM